MFHPVDLALLLLFFVVWPFLDFILVLPRMKAALVRGDAGARVRIYRLTLAIQWGFVALLLAYTVAGGRPSLALGGLPDGALPALAALGLASAGIVFFSRQTRAARRASPAQLAPVRAAIAPIAWFLPQTRAEWRWFVPVAWTAGVCEEILYRGFALGVLSQAMPLPAAVVAQAVLFGAAHAYQGRVGVLRTGIVGLLLGAIVAATGTLLAAMVIHVATDLSGGSLAYLVLAEEAPADQPSGVAATMR